MSDKQAVKDRCSSSQLVLRPQWPLPRHDALQGWSRGGSLTSLIHQHSIDAQALSADSADQGFEDDFADLLLDESFEEGTKGPTSLHPFDQTRLPEKPKERTRKLTRFHEAIHPDSPAAFATPFSCLSSHPPAASHLSRHSLMSSGTFSSGVFGTAASYLSIGSRGEVKPSKRPVLFADPEHTARARAAGMLDDDLEEIDWSGQGMHIQVSDESELPFTEEIEIATTPRAAVHAVLCRRVRLARKTILCHRRFTAKEAFREVKHLHKLQHSHVIRLVGSYMQRRYLSILTYPVADFDLDFFLRSTNIDEHGRACALRQSLGCLVSALCYVHESGIKHMDIKPKNILVRLPRTVRYTGYNEHKKHLLLTDFGISRTIIDDLNTETDGGTERTEMYCSPEVAALETRGRSSDIFSLGCVFAEIFTVVSGRTLKEFLEKRTDDGSAFYRNLSLVRKWMNEVANAAFASGHWDRLCSASCSLADYYDRSPTSFSNLKEIILRMLDPDKTLRPSSRELSSLLRPCSSCTSGPPAFKYDFNDLEMTGPKAGTAQSGTLYYYRELQD